MKCSGGCVVHANMLKFDSISHPVIVIQSYLPDHSCLHSFLKSQLYNNIYFYIRLISRRLSAKRWKVVAWLKMGIETIFMHSYSRRHYAYSIIGAGNRYFLARQFLLQSSTSRCLHVLLYLQTVVLHS